MNVPDYEAIARSGVEALRRGSGAEARAEFEKVAGAGRASHQLWLLLAQACEMTGDDPAMEQALATVLEHEPRNLHALLMKGEYQMRQGDDRAATSWFGLALSSVGQQQNLASDLIARLQRAQQAMRASEQKFEDHLYTMLAAGGVDAAHAGPRFAEALEILNGRAQPQLQQPTSFYYPRLPQIPFYDSTAFDWVAGLEAATPAILAEVEAVLAADQDFAPYVQRNSDRPTREHVLLDDPSWSAYYLWQDGVLNAQHAEVCPATVLALEGLPIPSIATRSPMALFSVLKAKTHIPPHWGMLNTRLIVHLPLVVPPNCRLRVGNEVRSVEAGKAMIFDDSIEHEAWNDSDETRVVLLFEIWRPELDAGECKALTTMLEAINAY